MNGIGTPSSKSNIERIYPSSYSKLSKSNDDDAIALTATDRCGKARAERPNQKRKEGPIHRVCDSLASLVSGLLSLGKNVIDSLLRVGFTDSRLRGHDLSKVCLVSGRDLSHAKSVCENKANLSDYRTIVLGRSRRTRSQKRIYEIAARATSCLGSRSIR